MRGIEAACSGVLAKDIELRTSKAGNAYANLSLAVNQGEDDDGRPVTQWVRVAIFGEIAELIAATAHRGDKLYVEGSLSLATWAGKDGEQRTGLNLAAWKAQKIGASAIGRNRKKSQGHAVASDSFRQPGESQAERQLRAASFDAEPHKREKPRVIGRDDFSDPLPF